MLAPSLASLASLTLWTLPALVAGTPLTEVQEEHPGHHHAARPNLVGARVGFLSVLADKGELEYLPGLLIGVSYERTVIHEWLEIEASIPVAVLFDGAQRLVALPIDLHFKKPFHPSPKVSPYVALGPAFDVLVAPELKVFFGGSLAVGTYVWPTPRVGIDIELDYNVVAEDRTAVHELLLAAGPVLRF